MITLFDDLPDDDESAFALQEQRERQKCEDRVDGLSDDWPIRQAQFDYFNTVWALADAAGIEELTKYPIVLMNSAEFCNHYAQFAAHAQRIVYSINFKAARQKRQESVELPAQAKGRIHSLIAKIREVVEAAELEEEKKRALLDRVGELEKEVDRPRTQLRVAMQMLLDVSATVGEAATNLTPLRKLVDMVIDVIAIAQREQHAALPAPPKRIATAKPIVKPSKLASKDQALDEEIPF